MTTYTTICWGQRYSIRANWAEASCPVEVRYEDDPWTTDPHGRQVANFCHRAEDAMRDWISSGENPEDRDTDAIDAAVAEMTASE